jgi:hypothetical protein
MDFVKGGRDKLRGFQAFCLILTFYGQPKKEQTATLQKLCMCQEFTIFTQMLLSKSSF